MKNYLEQCVEVQYLLNVTSLDPVLFSDDSYIGSTNNRSLRINLVVDNRKIVVRYKNFDIFSFKEAMKINAIKSTLNTA